MWGACGVEERNLKEKFFLHFKEVTLLKGEKKTHKRHVTGTWIRKKVGPVFLTVLYVEFFHSTPQAE